MRCMRCGAELRPDAKFCGVCGQVLGGSGSSGGGYSQNTGNYQPRGSYPQDTGNYQPQGGYQNTGNYQPSGSMPQDQGYGAGKILEGLGKVKNQASEYMANRARQREIQEATKASSANRMPQGVALGSDERIVKSYRIGRFSFRQGAIDLIVTNKRVIRYEESSLFGLKNNRIDEINIDAVHGVSTDMRRSISPFGILVSLAALIVGIGALNTKDSSPLITIGAFALFAIVLYLSLRPTLLFRIHGSVGGEVLDTRVNDKGRILRPGNGTTPGFQFKPTPETTVMLKEIGALMYDLKTLGDAAIPRWM